MENLNKKKIAFIVPSLANKGPILVVNELVKEFIKNGHTCTVFYFDEKTELDFNCPVQKIDKNEKLDFSQFDIVHSHGMRPDKYVFINRNQSDSKTLFISTMHNYVMQDLRYQYNRIIALIFGNLWMHWLGKHDKIVTLSQDAQNYYLRWFSPEKLSYAYNTRNLDITKKLSNNELKDLESFKGNSVLIGVNALLSHRKGIDLLISALVLLPTYKLFIVGAGKSRVKLEQLALKYGINERCYFAGYKHDAFRYLPHYDIYAIPSRSEGFPLSLLEAAIYSIPTVGSNIPIIKEAFNSQEVSFFSLTNPLTIIDAIKKATNNKSFGIKMHERYQTSYSPEICYKRYLDIYNGKF